MTTVPGDTVRPSPRPFGYVDVPLIESDESMVQGELFALSQDGEPVRGYRGTVACRLAGITYRQLDYWARKRIVVPSIKASHGSGSRRLYAFRDLVILAVSKKLLDIGINLQNVTNAVEYLMGQPDALLARMTIVCNGHHVQECVEGEQMARMLQEGDAVFGVSVAAIWGRLARACEHEDHVELPAGAHDAPRGGTDRLVRPALPGRTMRRGTGSSAIQPTMVEPA